MIKLLVSKRYCPACNMTKRWLDERSIEYEIYTSKYDLSADDQLIANHYKQAPIVVTDKGHWSGFRPDELKRLVN